MKKRIVQMIVEMYIAINAIMRKMFVAAYRNLPADYIKEELHKFFTQMDTVTSNMLTEGFAFAKMDKDVLESIIGENLNPEESIESMLPELPLEVLFGVIKQYPIYTIVDERGVKSMDVCSINIEYTQDGMIYTVEYAAFIYGGGRYQTTWIKGYDTRNLVNRIKEESEKSKQQCHT